MGETSVLSSGGPEKPKVEAFEVKLEERRRVEELHLRRVEFLDRLIQRLPTGTPARQLVEAFADSFIFQLVGILTLTVLLVIIVHLIDPTARFAPSLLYIYFLATGLYFARFRPHHALIATLSLLMLGILLFTIPIGSGEAARPLLAFRPTMLFWVSVGVIAGMATVLFNQHVESLVDSRVSLFALQRQVRDRDETSGKAIREDKVEEQFSIARQAETSRRDVVRHYSSLFLYMQKLSQNLQPIELVSAVWGILKHGIQATACEIYAYKDNQLELTQAFRIPAGVNLDDLANQSFDERVSKGGDLVPLSECPHRTIPVGAEAQNILAHVVLSRKSVGFEDISRDPMLQALGGRSPVPVAYAYPLIDAKNNTVKGVINISQCRRTKQTDEERQILRTTADLSAMAITHWEALEAERGAKLALKKQFATYVSPSVVRQIMENPDLVEPRRQKITVMFVDLRGFTNISEANPPQVVVALLSDFFGRLTPLIFEHQGTLDKYIGDEIMALWGAPAATSFDTRRAVLAAWRMQEAFVEVKTKWTPRLGRPAEIGIAINTGEAMVGSIGSETLKNYTAIGDAVNTAARLEGVTGAGKIQITRPTYDEVKDMVEGEWQTPVRVQGKAEPLEMFLVTNVKLEMVESTPVRDEKSALEISQIMSSRDLARQIRSGPAKPGEPPGRPRVGLGGPDERSEGPTISENGARIASAAGDLSQLRPTNPPRRVQPASPLEQSGSLRVPRTEPGPPRQNPGARSAFSSLSGTEKMTPAAPRRDPVAPPGVKRDKEPADET